MKAELSFGGAGVHVFILISGFGLYLSYLKISYEWYLVHGLTFLIFRGWLKTVIPAPFALFVCLTISYIFAYVYGSLLTKIGVKKQN